MAGAGFQVVGEADRVDGTGQAQPAAAPVVRQFRLDEAAESLADFSTAARRAVAVAFPPVQLGLAQWGEQASRQIVQSGLLASITKTAHVQSSIQTVLANSGVQVAMRGAAIGAQLSRIAGGYLPLVPRLDVQDLLLPSLLPKVASWAGGFAQIGLAHQRVLADLAGQQRELREVLDRALRQWGELADVGLGVGRWLAQAALSAAMQAREAYLHGENQPVDDFIRYWLEQQPEPWRREAVIEVLLGSEWIPVQPPTFGLGVLKRIKDLAGQKTRDYKLLSQTKLLGHTVAMLDQPLRGPGASRTLLDDLSSHSLSSTAALEGEFRDKRLARLLAQLTPIERRVALARGSVDSWAEAASLVGAPPELAERTRRKCGRIRREMQRREAAQTLPPRQA